MSALKQLFREPIFHFFVLGAGLFLIYLLMGDPAQSEKVGSESRRVIVTPGRIEQLVVGFTRTWQRPPTQRELDGLVEDYIREEIYYRDALAMGLDRDDTIVRRRLRQKLEFLTEEVPEMKPSDEELKAYFEKNPDPFRKDPRIAFRHVYVNADRRGKSAAADAKQILRQLVTGIDPDTVGDTFLLPFDFELSDTAEISRLFGNKFSIQIQDIEPGRWTGPIESGYGLHLVLVQKRVPGGVPELREVRDDVQREWLVARQREMKEKAYRARRERYTVIVEQPAFAAADATKIVEAR